MYLDIEIRGAIQKVEQLTTLITDALRTERITDVPSPYRADQVTRYITVDAEQTRPLKPIPREKLTHG